MRERGRAQEFLNPSLGFGCLRALFVPPSCPRLHQKRNGDVHHHHLSHSSSIVYLSISIVRRAMQAQPIQPFCVVASNGTVYAAAFAYNRRAISTAPDPDWFVLVQGSLSPPSPAATVAKPLDVTWTVVSLTLRTALNLFPEVPFFYNCALSPDGATFLLRVALETQQFTVSLSTIANSTAPIGYVPDSGTGNGTSNPFLATGLSILLPVQEPSPVLSSIDATTDQEWIQVQVERLGNMMYISQTTQGSFPRTPQISVPITWTTACYGLAYDQDALYMLSTNTLINGTTLIQSVPWTYNASLPNWIAPIPLSSVLNFTAAESPICASNLTVMTTLGSILHMICFSDEPNSYTPSYMQWDTKAAKLRDATTLGSIATKPQIGGTANPTLAVFNDNISLYADGQSLFWTDLSQGLLQKFTIDVDAAYTSNNMNPDMTTSPMTLSSLDTLVIVVGALFLGVLLVCFQRLFFRWQARRWLKEMEALGSKVMVEDVEAEDSDTDREDLPSTRPKLRRRTTSAPTFAENNTGHISTPSSSSQSTAVNGLMLFEPSAPTMLGVGEPLSAEGQSAGEVRDGYEMHTFSNHPRPTIVTTITDGSTDEITHE